ncbi:MetQ/NlpA family ABC transporter substrate-binding protein [Campylobacter suis]|uniref:Membrane lipoprotein TpN32 n=1 Tax=Campylobacter suis TaxID=2790657 RepID=A0ABM8Q227_9BACT|nr:MetQ/NlpA family ABC transporter substrate-binding protein [Campylobacter suis]CAD7286840.1 Membrane lipoprotein TpN32 [Campylobacter suis]
MIFKKLLLAALLTLGLNASDNKIKIAISPVPHAQIMQIAKPLLKKDGYELEIIEISDYSIPNIATQDGSIDANFFQHLPYLQNQNETLSLNLVSMAGIHLEPLGFYSNKIKSLAELKNGAKIAIAHDPSNGNRALQILAKAGLITLKDGVKFASIHDIEHNPKELKFIELEGALIPRTLDEVDLAAISTNFVLDMGLNPSKDALFIENTDSPYANIIVVKSGNENSPKTKALIKATTSDEVRNFIKNEYKGSVLPTF